MYCLPAVPPRVAQAAAERVLTTPWDCVSGAFAGFSRCFRDAMREGRMEWW